ncbi:MAG: DUF488 domain-containing protein [Anaerolineae bacterium]|nr:DUF488 domain-containing protein [Anaerolineae bacterium]
MATIYTIGYQKKPLSVFINQLRDAGVDAVIDVRLRNTSHLAGYTKKDTLDFLLTEGFGIAYEHHPELAPSDELFDAYRQKRLLWPALASQVRALLEERKAEEAGATLLDRYQAACLLCAEPTADRCHRRIVAEYWQAHLLDLTIVHL